MKFAVIKFAGGQYRVEENEKLVLAGFWGEKGKEIALEPVLLYSEEDQTLIGKPFLSQVSVKAEVLDQYLGEKVTVAKFKAKTGYRRKMGFRPHQTTFLIKKITLK